MSEVKEFKPEQRHLQNYADIMANFALNLGKGIKPGETVLLFANECTKPLYWEIYKAVIKAGGNVIPYYLPNEATRYGENRTLFEHGSDEQLSFSPVKFWEGMVDQIDHILFIISEHNVHLLEGIPEDKIMMVQKARGPLVEMRAQKEQRGDLSWTLCLYPTESMAKEAGMSLDEYWEQIVLACQLDNDNPVAEWQRITSETEHVRQTLTDMQIEKVHIEGDDADLWIQIGEQRQWLGGSGRNIPSFEIYVSPDWRGTNGWIRFNQPLYYVGKKISGIELHFENGLVTKATAEENEDALLAMIAEENADKVGEYSLTDGRHSPITKFMATTLYDENAGGKEGNTHLALGNSYRDSWTGDLTKADDGVFEELGFNKCKTVHTDIVSTTKRKVTAYLPDGSNVVIYENGQFTFLK